MPISFSCTCGKRLRARDEFAGRKIKCPACQAIVLIPEPVAADVAPPAPAPLLAEASPDVLLARPVEVVAARPISAPVAKPLPTGHNAANTPYHPWIDRSLEQTATPWLGDDEERFNAGMEFRDAAPLWPVLLALVVAGVGAAAFLLVTK